MSYKNLQHYRHTVHRYLDFIWLMSSNKRQARNTMYKLLSIKMNIPIEDTHVSMFNRAQCKQAIAILRPMYIQLKGTDLKYKKRNKVRSNDMYSMIVNVDRELQLADYGLRVADFKLMVYCNAQDIADNIMDYDDIVTIIDSFISENNIMTAGQFTKYLLEKIPYCTKVELTDKENVTWIYEIPNQYKK